MHWEVWALETGNLIAAPGTEGEALAQFVLPEDELVPGAGPEAGRQLAIHSECEQATPAASGEAGHGSHHSRIRAQPLGTCVSWQPEEDAG
jgi:hypothetical protein